MKKKITTPIIISLIIILIGISSLLFIYYQAERTQIEVEEPVVGQVIDEQPTDLKTIIHQAEKNVVQIENNSGSESITGSGFLFNENGDIITNAHVIKDADVINVRTADAHIYPAAIVGSSEDTDIAVIRVPQLAGEPYLPLEEELLAETGDEVIALGSPHGFQNTVTLGIISGTKRNFSIDSFDYNNVYQISAQITHGNSGGPLINRETGHVIGINSVGTDDGMIGFSIPIKEIIDQVKHWVAETDKDDLDYPSSGDLLTFNPDQLKEDSAYLIEYFFDGIHLRDYVNAYTLLGSDMQAEMSYADFREQYIHIVDLDYEEKSSQINDDENVDTTVKVTIEEKQQNEDEPVEVQHEYDFTIGYENDQLKILNVISD